MGDNFQDNIAYGNSTLSVSGNAVQIGDGAAGSKSINFSNNNGVGSLVWGPSVNRTISIPDANGMIMLTSQGILSISGGTNTITSGQAIFSNSNGISFGVNGQTITASHNGITSQTNQTVGLYALGNTTQNSSTTLDARTLSFNGLGGATVGYSNGSVQISVPVQTVQTQSNIQGIYDGANSISTGTIRFSNSNGVSFGINGQTITASHNGITSQTNQTVGLYAVGNTTGQSSSTLDARSLSFSGSGNISVGYSNGSIIIGQTGGGGQTAQTVGLYAVGNTTQNSSTTLDARTLSFNGLGAATVGYSNGSIQVSAPVTSSLVGTGGVRLSSNGSTVSISGENYNFFNNFSGAQRLTINATDNNASLHLEPMMVPNIQFDRVVFPILLSYATNTTGSATLSQWIGFYIKNVSTLSLMHSSSTTVGITYSGTVNSSILSGPRIFNIGWTTTIPQSNYWVGVLYRSTTGGNNATFSQFIQSQQSYVFSGVLGSASNTSAGILLGQGYFTATTSNLPSTINFTNIQQSLSKALQPPLWHVISGTV